MNAEALMKKDEPKPAAADLRDAAGDLSLAARMLDPSEDIAGLMSNAEYASWSELIRDHAQRMGLDELNALEELDHIAMGIGWILGWGKDTPFAIEVCREMIVRARDLAAVVKARRGIRE